jgi:hypothetical protein
MQFQEQKHTQTTPRMMKGENQQKDGNVNKKNNQNDNRQ